MSSETTTGGADGALAGSNVLVDLAPCIFGQEQAGWLVTIEPADGLVQIDTGDQARASPAAIRSRTDAPFTHIVFSHGHQRARLSAAAERPASRPTCSGAPTTSTPARATPPERHPGHDRTGLSPAPLVRQAVASR